MLRPYRRKRVSALGDGGTVVIGDIQTGLVHAAIER
jgi:hypothetical protein